MGSVISLAKMRSRLAGMNRFLTKHNFDKTPLPVEAPATESVIIIYAFTQKRQSNSKLMVYRCPSQIESYLAAKGSLKKK
jgi:DNA polymerase-3 subunit alpha/error-prone DNA polymerase